MKPAVSLHGPGVRNSLRRKQLELLGLKKCNRVVIRTDWSLKAPAFFKSNSLPVRVGRAFRR